MPGNTNRWISTVINIVLSCLVLSCIVLSCIILSFLVLYCLVVIQLIQGRVLGIYLFFESFNETNIKKKQILLHIYRPVSGD